MATPRTDTSAIGDPADDARRWVEDAADRRDVRDVHTSGDVANASPVSPGRPGPTDGPAREGAGLGSDEGLALKVTLIRPGRSANGYLYTPEVLRAILPLWEGAAAFVDHPTALDLTRAGQRSLRDLVGAYRAPRWEQGAMRATLHVYPGARWAYDLAAATIADRAAARPVADVGISADLRVRRQPNGEGWTVERITRVAGPGKPIATTPAYDPARRRNSMPDANVQVLTPRAAPTDIAAEGGAMMHPAPGGLTPTGGAPSPRADEVPVAHAANGAAPATLEADLVRLEEVRRRACGELLRLTLSGSDLPEPASALVRSEFASRVFEATELDARIGALRTMLGAVFAPSAVRGHGAARPEVRVGLNPLDRVQAGLDRLFDLPLPDGLSGVPRLSGIREAYLALTGDTLFTGRPHPENAVVREANEVTTSVLANALANSMMKRIVMDYRAQPR